MQYCGRESEIVTFAAERLQRDDEALLRTYYFQITPEIRFYVDIDYEPIPADAVFIMWRSKYMELLTLPARYGWSLQKLMNFQLEGLYLCMIEGRRYVPMFTRDVGWSALDQCYALLKAYNEKWKFKRGEVLSHRLDKLYEHEPLPPAFQPAILTRSSRPGLSYYLITQIEKTPPFCLSCGRSIPGVILEQDGDDDVIHLSESDVLWSMGRSGYVGRIPHDIETLVRENNLRYGYCCCGDCYSHALKNTKTLISQEAKQWLQKEKERLTLRKMKELLPKTRKALRSRNRDALLSLQGEYKQVATSQS